MMNETRPTEAHNSWTFPLKLKTDDIHINKSTNRIFLDRVAKQNLFTEVRCK